MSACRAREPNSKIGFWRAPQMAGFEGRSAPTKMLPEKLEWAVYDKRRPEVCTFGPPCSEEHVLLSTLQTHFKPIQHFLLHPSNTVRAQHYPLGEFACLFQSGDVLRGVQKQLAERLFRQYPHHDVSLKRSIAMPRFRLPLAEDARYYDGNWIVARLYGQPLFVSLLG